MQLTTRVLTEQDVGLWRALRHEAVLDIGDIFVPTLQEVDAMTEARDRAMLSQGGCFGLFAEGDGAGIIRLHPYMFARERHRMHLGQMYVRPRYRRHGGAAALFDVSFRAAKAAGALQVESYVTVDNADVLRACERAGFEHLGTLPRAARKDDGTFRDEIFMIRRLDDYT